MVIFGLGIFCGFQLPNTVLFSEATENSTACMVGHVVHCTRAQVQEDDQVLKSSLHPTNHAWYPAQGHVPCGSHKAILWTSSGPIPQFSFMDNHMG